MTDKIIICRNHPEYQVPLIWTFAFRGAEYWCPYCGSTSGMLGAGDRVDATDELQDRLKAFEKISDEFLHATGVLICSSMEFEGRQITYEELPDNEKDRLKVVRENWKYKQVL